MSNPITLTDTIGKGGEATIYAIAQQPNVVAKIYHQPTAAHEAKLRAMVENPPEQPRSHVALAWPTALIYQTKAGQLASYVDHYPNGEQFVGFLMPKISSGHAPNGAPMARCPINRGTVPRDLQKETSL